MHTGLCTAYADTRERKLFTLRSLFRIYFNIYCRHPYSTDYQECMSLWVFILNFDDENMDISKGGGAEFVFVDETTLAWESEFIKIGLNSSTTTLNVMVGSPRSFSDISDETVFVDSKLMVSGYIIMFIYTILMLEKIDLQEMRLYLTIAGLLCIAPVWVLL